MNTLFLQEQAVQASVHSFPVAAVGSLKLALAPQSAVMDHVMQGTGHSNSRHRDNKPPALNAADVAGSVGVGSGMSGERSTPSSSPNSTSNPLRQQTSSSRLDSPAGEAPAGKDASPDSQQFRHGSVPGQQQELQRRFQQDGSTPQHSQVPTAMGGASAGKSQGRDVALETAGRPAQGALQHLQESTGSRLAISSHQQQQEGAAGYDQAGEEDEAEEAGQVCCLLPVFKLMCVLFALHG